MIKRIEKPEITREDLQKYVKEINLSQRFFPIKSQRELIVGLLKGWDDPERTSKVVVIKEIVGKKFPLMATYGIISYDWPGLADTSIGLFHEKGWNLYFVKAFNLEHRTESLGVILIGIKINNEKDLEKISRDDEEIFKDIEYVISGSQPKQSLIAEEIKKLRLYGKLVEAIKREYQGEYLQEIIEEEAVKFISARSREYLEERRIEDLAKIVIFNRILSKKAAKEGKIQINIMDIPTKRGIFTAITAADRVDKLSLEDMVRILWHIYPDHRVMFYKEYKTRDGIAVIHVEVVDERTNPLPEGVKMKLKDFLENKFLKSQVRRAERIQRIGGFEHYARAIIPVLIREAENTGLPQVFFSAVGATEFNVEFKLIVVHKVRESYKIIRELQKVTGVEIRSAKNPRRMGNWYYEIIDLRIYLEYFSSIEEIYQNLKKALREVIGEFRDFDEGMREAEKIKYVVIKKKLTDIPPRILREFYYSLEDFYRVSASEDELITLMKMGWTCLKDQRTSCFQISEFNSSTLLSIKTPSNPILIPKLVEAFTEYEPIISRVEMEERDIIFLKLRDCKDENRIKRTISTILEEEDLTS